MPTSKTSKTSKKRTAYHHGDLRHALVEAGLQIIEKEGAEALSLRSVARKTGVSQAAPYAHFKDKHAILEAIGKQGFDMLSGYMRRYEKMARDLPSTLTAYGVAYVSFAVDHRHLFKLMFGPELTRRDSEDFITTASTSYEMILDISQDLLGPDGNDERKVSLHAMFAWSVVHGLANLIVDGKLDEQLTQAGTAEALAETMLTSTPPIVGSLKKP